MMQYPLCSPVHDRAARLFAKQEIVSVYSNQPSVTPTEMGPSTCHSHAPSSRGLKKGSRGVVPLNNHRHLELYFGVPAWARYAHAERRLSQDTHLYR